MKKSTRILSLAMATLMTATAFSGCSSSAPQSSAPAFRFRSIRFNRKDTITALLPPVSPNYQKNFDQMAKDFTAKYPNLTLKIEPTSWEDITQKLDTQVQAGSPPDISFIGSDGISKYVDSGLIQDISKVATSDMIADFEEGPLNYMKNGSGLYGFLHIWKSTASVATSKCWKQPALTGRPFKQKAGPLMSLEKL